MNTRKIEQLNMISKKHFYLKAIYINLPNYKIKKIIKIVSYKNIKTE